MVIFDQLTGFYDDTVLSAPPENEAELLTRAQALAGYTLSELAQQAGIPTPADLRRDKGWVGMLLEIHLGASAGSKPERDFAHLGVELKTIPVDAQGRPLETTFVCVAPLTGNSGVTGRTVMYAISWRACCGFRLREIARCRWRRAASARRCSGAPRRKRKICCGATGKN